MTVKLSDNRGITRCVAMLLIFLFVAGVFQPGTSCAETQSKPVRVGYYENEVFQEGAAEGIVKTGYAYEYYRKLSEYNPIILSNRIQRQELQRNQQH